MWFRQANRVLEGVQSDVSPAGRVEGSRPQDLDLDHGSGPCAVLGRLQEAVEQLGFRQQVSDM